MNLGNDLKKHAFFVSAAVLFFGLLLIQAISDFGESSRKKVVGKAVESIFRSEKIVENPYLMAQAIEDLERSGLIECSVLKTDGSQALPFLDLRRRDSCTNAALWPFQSGVELRVIAINGTRWSFSFDTPYSETAFLAIWIARILMGSMSSLLWLSLRRRNQIEELKISNAIQLAEIADQVAHDIRSPLATLEVLLEETTAIPENHRNLIREASSRIHGIASDLLRKNRKNEIKGHHSEIRSEHLMSLIYEIVIEKRIQFRGHSSIEISFDFHPESVMLFVPVSKSTFKRVISNLINNSFEAMEAGKISISAKPDDRFAVVNVEDNGKGIPNFLIEAGLGNRKLSFGKEDSGSGNGLGLFNAKKEALGWGGCLEIESQENVGTRVSIRIPTCPIPKWFPNEIRLGRNQEVVLIDDDPSMSRAWDLLLSPMGKKVDFYFSSPLDFRNWFASRPPGQKIFCIVDFEFPSSSESGLDLIKDLNIAPFSMLVTGRAGETNIQYEALKLGLSLLPKVAISELPIRILDIQDSVRSGDVVLLDDDTNIHELWKIAGQRYDRRVFCFKRPAELLNALSNISLDTPIYVDVNLGEDEMSGEEFSRILFNKGYQNLYLATGSASDKFESSNWIKLVVGKRPPWT